MKRQKDVKRIVVCVLCAVAVVVLSAGALAAGPCTYQDPNTRIVCGKARSRQVVKYFDVQTGSHTYIDEWGNTALCNYSYFDTIEADVCPDGHWNNVSSGHYEYDHACWYAGR